MTPLVLNQGGGVWFALLVCFCDSQPDLGYPLPPSLTRLILVQGGRWVAKHRSQALPLALNLRGNSRSEFEYLISQSCFHNQGPHRWPECPGQNTVPSSAGAAVRPQLGPHHLFSGEPSG